MTARKFSLVTDPPATPGRINGGSERPSVLEFEQRLASVERELRVQFTRIAQVQAELDLVSGAFRRRRMASAAK